MKNIEETGRRAYNNALEFVVETFFKEHPNNGKRVYMFCIS